MAPDKNLAKEPEKEGEVQIKTRRAETQRLGEGDTW